MNRVLLIGLCIILVAAGVWIYTSRIKNWIQSRSSVSTTQSSNDDPAGGLTGNLNPLAIEAMRKREYPGSDIVIEQTLPPGSNYNRYIASYKSEGLKIYALLTVPQNDKPKNGWPVIIFNHGYIPPEQYVTTERYVTYTDAFSRNGYIVFKSDYRGHGNSEGKPEGPYYSPAYTVDVLNGLASVKRLKASTFEMNTNDSGQVVNTRMSTRMTDGPVVDPSKIGMWGHSMGGHITLRAMVVSKEIAAGVIWGGVVASYQDLATKWRRARPFQPSQREQISRVNNVRQRLTQQYGSFEQNPTFWNSISPIYFVKDISGPLALFQAKGDEEVPWEFSQTLYDDMKKVNKEVELHLYEGDDHNISQNFDSAMADSIAFFDKYIK